MIKLKQIVGFAVFIILATGELSPVRADGLQGEFLSTQYWRDLLSRYSPLTNPAFLTEENYVTIRGAEALVMQTFNLTEVGVTVPVGLYESWGLSYFGQGVGQIQSAINDVAGDSIKELGQTLSDAKHYFMLSYANNLWGGLSLGANATFSYETNFSDPVMSSAIDIGLSYRLVRDPVFGEHLLGLSMQNILSPFDFGKLSYSNNVKLAWLGYYFDRQLESGFEIDSKNIYNSLFRDKDPTHMEFTYAARLGAWVLRFLNIYAQIGSNYFGFAGGVNVPQFNDGRDMSFLYQYINRTDATADAIHSVYMRIQFGPHREEVYAKQMAHFVDVGPNDLYIKACKLYYAGNFWDAFFTFGQIAVQYPSFFKNDQVAYYKASCLENLDMRNEAELSYKKTEQDFPKSIVVPHVDLGLMRIAYRNDDYQSVYDKFQSLNSSEIPDSLKYHAYYLMGESYFKKKNYTQASKLLSLIPETHEQYVFAQHSKAIIHILSSETDSAIATLGNCVQAIALTDAQKEIVNRSYVILGYLFYGQNEMSKAVSSLRAVQKNSYYYEDALLGLCWSALRARQWNDCITNGQELQKISNKLPVKCDASLIEGYGNLMLKNYKQATSILSAASEKAKALKSPPADSMDAKRKAYKNNRNDYNGLAISVEKIAQELQSLSVIKRIDSLHAQQESKKKSIDGFLSFQNEFGRQAFFARNSDVIKNDIDYTLAISQKTSRESPSAEVQKQAESKQKEIDEKINKLKKDLGKLNNAPDSNTVAPK